LEEDLLKATRLADKKVSPDKTRGEET